MKYRKKPVVVEAVLFDGKNHDKVRDFANNGDVVSVRQYIVEIRTLEGTMVGNVGDWIIKGVKGEFYPCKPDIFEMTYEAVD